MAQVREIELVDREFEQVFGPVLHEVSSPKGLNSSMDAFFNNVLAKAPLPKEYTPEGSWVDVRDVAHAHIRALQIPEAGGKRFVVSTGAYVWQDWCT